MIEEAEVPSVSPVISFTEVVLEPLNVKVSPEAGTPEPPQLAEVFQLLPSPPVHVKAAANDAGAPAVMAADVADAFVDSLTDAATFGQAYDLVGPKTYSLRELVDYTAGLVGSNASVIALSEGWAYLQAGLMWLAPQPLLSPDNLRSMQIDSVADAGSQTPASWQPTALEAVAPTYIALNTPKGKLDSFRFHAGR